MKVLSHLLVGITIAGGLGSQAWSLSGSEIQAGKDCMVPWAQQDGCVAWGTLEADQKHMHKIGQKLFSQLSRGAKVVSTYIREPGGKYNNASRRLFVFYVSAKNPIVPCAVEKIFPGSFVQSRERQADGTYFLHVHVPRSCNQPLTEETLTHGPADATPPSNCYESYMLENWSHCVPHHGQDQETLGKVAQEVLEKCMKGVKVVQPWIKEPLSGKELTPKDKKTFGFFVESKEALSPQAIRQVIPEAGVYGFGSQKGGGHLSEVTFVRDVDAPMCANTLASL